MRVNELVETSNTILLPKGEANQKCVSTFLRYFGIEKPEFKPGRLWTESNGREFYKVKAIDIPKLLERGYGDVGAACTDVCMEFDRQKSIRYYALGQPICRFSILALEDRATEIAEILEDKDHWPTPALLVPTSYPKMLQKAALLSKMPIAPTNITLSGSIEIMPRLTGLGVAADIVETGETLRQQGDVVEVKSIWDIYACVVAATRNIQ